MAEGILAVNKPTGISSAEALRKLQHLFKPSPVFQASLEAEKDRRNQESRNQRHRRRNKKVEVKIGHGGTLDPLASGILIVGIFRGTKQLGKFTTECTKTYEVTAILGCETDTYDSQGKIIRWAKWDHVQKKTVEDALDAFRGDIMQKPPIYSALHQNGMRLYEYARKGIPLPVEIKARPVRTESLEFLDFTFDHNYEYPKEEAPAEEKVVSEALEKQLHEKHTAAKPESSAEAAKTEEQAIVEEATTDDRPTSIEAPPAHRKRSRSPTPSDPAAKKQKAENSTAVPTDSFTTTADTPATAVPPTTKPPGKPPALVFRLKVTSGFYVRSFIHDLGQALGSAAHMVKLVRTQQGEYELGGPNTFEWEELMEDPEKKWEPKVERVLGEWVEKNPKP